MTDLITIPNLYAHIHNQDETINSLMRGRSPVEEDCTSTAEQKKQESTTSNEDPTPH